MKIIMADGVHEALMNAMILMSDLGVERDSRNGPVLQTPFPVSTVYLTPQERVLFWPGRDANPFFHLYEALWMLCGRNDVAGPKRYVSTFGAYSDDGETLHGAYGFRWKRHFIPEQLSMIAGMLQKNPDDRRAVLQMWDANADLGRDGKDLPCNTMATFQINPRGKLDLSVFCRSNDIIWGCYGANAVHFSILLEYMANWIGVQMGTYTQISVNWHAYRKTFDPLLEAWKASPPMKSVYRQARPRIFSIRGDIQWVDENIRSIVAAADNSFRTPMTLEEPWANVMYSVLYAHHLYKTKSRLAALEHLYQNDQGTDWELAAIEWLQRRADKKQA